MTSDSGSSKSTSSVSEPEGEPCNCCSGITPKTLVGIVFGVSDCIECPSNHAIWWNSHGAWYLEQLDECTWVACEDGGPAEACPEMFYPGHSCYVITVLVSCTPESFEGAGDGSVTINAQIEACYGFCNEDRNCQTVAVGQKTIAGSGKIDCTDIGDITFDGMLTSDCFQGATITL